MLKYFGAFFPPALQLVNLLAGYCVSERDSGSFVSKRCVLLLLLQDMHHCKTSTNWFM